MADRVLITGGSRGIGKATVAWFAQRGWQVAFCYHSNKSAAEQVLKQYPQALAFQTDVADEEQVCAMFKAIKEQWGGLDALVCNAGIALPQQLLTDTSAVDMDRLYNVNVKGTLLCCREGAKLMVPCHRGAMVTLSSVWGQSGGSCETVYSATKGAVIALTKALAKELGPSGIRVNCVSPGVIDTDMNGHLSEEDKAELANRAALMRLGTPDDVADAIGFLCSESAAYVTGQVLGVDGGFE